MVDIILKARNSEGRTKEYLRFKGGVTLLEGGAVSILTSQNTRNRILFSNIEVEED